MKLLLTVLTFLVTAPAWAQSNDVWGKAPEASDDRFSNPKKALYAGPDGWWNTGEVRATVNNAAKTVLGFKGSFQVINNDPIAVQDKQTLHFDFGGEDLPTAGTYQIGDNGSLVDKKVKLSFADVGNNQINEWSSESGAGTLTVSLVNGFIYFTCRNVALQPSGLSNKGETAKPLVLGFEGALKAE